MKKYRKIKIKMKDGQIKFCTILIDKMTRLLILLLRTNLQNRNKKLKFLPNNRR